MDEVQFGERFFRPLLEMGDESRIGFAYFVFLGDGCVRNVIEQRGRSGADFLF